jgi:hypothetical protein
MVPAIAYYRASALISLQVAVVVELLPDNFPRQCPSSAGHRIFCASESPMIHTCWSSHTPSYCTDDACNAHWPVIACFRSHLHRDACNAHLSAIACFREHLHRWCFLLAIAYVQLPHDGHRRFLLTPSPTMLHIFRPSYTQSFCTVDACYAFRRFFFFTSASMVTLVFADFC